MNSYLEQNEEDLQQRLQETYERGPVRVDSVRTEDYDVGIDESLGDEIVLPEGDYDLERRQVDFEDGSSAIEYTIQGPERLAVKASVGSSESFTSTDNIELSSSLDQEISRGQVNYLWDELKNSEEDDEPLLAGFSRLK